MIDSYCRTSYQKIFVEPVLHSLIRYKIEPCALTCWALCTGLAIIPALEMDWKAAALFFLLLSGYLDTLDGSLARARNQASPQGAVLDIVSDRIVEFAIIMGLYLVQPESRGLISLLMLGSILICVTSFLVVGIFIPNSGLKGFHYSPGLMERSEAFLFFAAMIIWPGLFFWLGCAFSVLLLATGCIRVKQFCLRTLK